MSGKKVEYNERLEDNKDKDTDAVLELNKKMIRNMEKALFVQIELLVV